MTRRLWSPSRSRPEACRHRVRIRSTSGGSAASTTRARVRRCSASGGLRWPPLRRSRPGTRGRDGGARRRPAPGRRGDRAQEPQGGSRRGVDRVVAVEPAKQAAQRAVRERGKRLRKRVSEPVDIEAEGRGRRLRAGRGDVRRRAGKTPGSRSCRRRSPSKVRRPCRSLSRGTFVRVGPTGWWRCRCRARRAGRGVGRRRLKKAGQSPMSVSALDIRSPGERAIALPKSMPTPCGRRG